MLKHWFIVLKMGLWVCTVCLLPFTFSMWICYYVKMSTFNMLIKTEGWVIETNVKRNNSFLFSMLSRSAAESDRNSVISWTKFHGISCRNISVWTVGPNRLTGIAIPTNHTAVYLKGVNFSWSQDLTCFLFSCQLKIQIQQQSQEIIVGVDGSLLDQFLQSLFERELTVDHEVR